MINLLLVLLVAWVAGALAARIGYPSILGELAAGILFGPAILGWLQPDDGLKALAEVGVFLLMLYIGIEVDHRDLAKASWGGLLAAVGGFLVPLAAGYATAHWFGSTHGESLFVGIALGVTALVVNSRIIVDLKLLGTRVANVLTAGALISDTAAIIIFAGALRMLEHGAAESAHGDAVIKLLMVTIKAVLFFGVTIFIGIKVFPYVGRRMTQAGFTQRTANFTLVLLVGLVFATMAELAELHAILGAFLAGLFLREEVLQRKLSQDIASLVHDLSIGFLAPIFFVTIGFEVDLRVFVTDLPLLVSILVVASLGKVLGTALFYLPTGHGWREGLVVGTGMNGRGAVEIVFAGLGLQAGVISHEIFSILVVMAFVTSASVPMLLKVGTEWLRSRGELARADEKRQGTVIVGAGPLARLLAGELAVSQPVRLVDSNREDCTIAQTMGLHVVHGNAMHEETLDMANLSSARTFIALTTNREVNAFSAQMARETFAVPEVYTPQTRREHDGQSPAAPTGEAVQIPLFGGEVALRDWNRWIARREVERVIFAVTEETAPASLFRTLDEEQGMLPLLVVREEAHRLFHTVEVLQPGDEVIALKRRQRDDVLQDRFDQIIEHCPILDLDRAMSVQAFFGLVADTMAPRVNVEAPVLLKMFLEREQDSSTVILPGLAIPHIVVDRPHVFDMLLARCREGVAFAGEAGSGVRLVFVIIGSKEERNFHLRVLSAIGQLFQHEEFEERWMTAQDAEELRRLVLSVERRRF